MAPQGKTKAGTGTQTNADTGTVEALLDMLSGDEDKEDEDEDEDEEFQVAPVKAEEAEESKEARRLRRKCDKSGKNFGRWAQDHANPNATS